MLLEDAVPVLTEYERPGRPVAVLYPANRNLATKVRVFVDFLVEITRRETPPE